MLGDGNEFDYSGCLLSAGIAQIKSSDFDIDNADVIDSVRFTRASRERVSQGEY